MRYAVKKKLESKLLFLSMTQIYSNGINKAYCSDN